MNTTPTSFEALPLDTLDQVTGGGIASKILGLFGEKGAKWGGIADNLLGMLGIGGGGAQSPAASSGAAPSPGAGGE